MLHINNEEENIRKEIQTAITIGSFDGFHGGHKKLINRINSIKEKKVLKSLALTFFPRPIKVLRCQDVKYLFDRLERTQIAETLGIDIFVEYPFTKEFSLMDGESFVSEILYRKYNCRHIVIGEGFRFGRGGMWDSKSLKTLSEKLGIEVDIIAHENYDDEKISSTAIRALIESGKVKEAAKLLGRDYFVLGTIGNNEHISYEVGNSIMNITPLSKDKLLPKRGVYRTNTFLPKTPAFSSVTLVENNLTTRLVSANIEVAANTFYSNICGGEVVIEFKEYLCDK